MFESLFRNKLNVGLLAAAVLGISLLFLGSLGKNNNYEGSESTDGKRQQIFQENTANEQNASEINRAELLLEQRLEQILKNVEGVGDVAVTVRLASGTEYQYAANNKITERKIEEEDQGGGRRLTTEQTKDGQLVLLRSGGTGAERAVVIKEISPQIEGVLVVAAGADSILVKEKLIKALETLLDVQPHRITVLAGKK